MLGSLLQNRWTNMNNTSSLLSAATTSMLLSFSPILAQTGPLVGTVKTEDAHFLYRPGAAEKSLRLSVIGPDQKVTATCDSISPQAQDYVAKFHVTGLTPSTSYTYQIDDLSSGAPVPILGPADGLRFKTDRPMGFKGVTTTAFISCANALTAFNAPISPPTPCGGRLAPSVCRGSTVERGG